MRKFSFMLLVLLLASNSTRAAETALDWSLATADGDTVRLSEEVKRQPVILFFWATWCPYCKALMPHLQSIRLEYGNDVKILAINFRDDNDPVTYVRGTGFDFTVLANGDDVAKMYDVWSTPGVIIVDKEQTIRFDLRDLPSKVPPKSANSDSHKSRAAYQAPYWAAQIRSTLDTLPGK